MTEIEEAKPKEIIMLRQETTKTKTKRQTITRHAYCHPIRRSRRRRALVAQGAEPMRTTWF